VHSLWRLAYVSESKGQVRDPGGQPGELKLKKIDSKQLLRTQPTLKVATSPIAREIRKSYTAGECSAEQAMVQMMAVRVTTARELMHRSPEGRSNRGTRPPQKPRTNEELERCGDIKGGINICGQPGQASAAAMQFEAEFRLYPGMTSK